MDKYEKYKMQAQKEKERAIKRTLRKARVPKNATPEQVKAYLINYVSKTKLGYYTLKFTDEQLADPDFLLGLYRANEAMLDFARPSTENEDLQSNIIFMIEYIKLAHAKNMREHKDEAYWSNQELAWIVEDYKKALSNPMFIERLAFEFPNCRIIPIIKNNFIKNYSMLDDDRKQKEQQDLENYKKCLNSLPIELLCKEVRRHGSVVIYDIPKDIKNFNQIIGAGIERDGFYALEKLDITQVLDNIDLIIKAYKKDGIKKLDAYINHSLRPLREHYYYCHGEPHSYTQFDQRYADVQEALKKDSKISCILEAERQLALALNEKQYKNNIKPTSFNNDNNDILKK